MGVNLGFMSGGIGDPDSGVGPRVRHDAVAERFVSRAAGDCEAGRGAVKPFEKIEDGAPAAFGGGVGIAVDHGDGFVEPLAHRQEAEPDFRGGCVDAAFDVVREEGAESDGFDVRHDANEANVVAARFHVPGGNGCGGVHGHEDLNALVVDGVGVGNGDGNAVGEARDISGSGYS